MSNIRVYLGDWHLNLGIVGFMNILDYSEIGYTKKANYLEFDSSILKEFPNYYFKFFLNKYSKKEGLQRSINYAKGSYSKGYMSLKDCNKTIREAIMYEAKKLSDKGTGFDNDAFLELKEITTVMSKLKDYTMEDLDVEIDKCMAILGSDRINERLTLNVIRSVFSNVYFGQASYLQKSGSKYMVEETADKLYKDYIYQLDTLITLRGIVEKGIIADISAYVDATLEDLGIKGKYSSKRVECISRILKDIKKVLTPSKKKPLDADDVLLSKINAILGNSDVCSVCDEFSLLSSDMTESIFAPTLLSSANSLNFYWDLNVNTKVCDVCRLMYLCADAGSVREGDKYTFVNMQSSIDDLYNSNAVLKNKVNRDSSFVELISYLVDTDIQKSKWRLQNIQIIEYFTDMESNKSRIGYYSIPNYLAKFLVSKDVSMLKGINNNKLKLKALKSLLLNKDIGSIILTELFEITKSRPSNWDVYFDLERLVQLRYIVGKYKEGCVETMQLKTLTMCKMRGTDIREAYKNSGTDSRLTTIIYKLLNTVKVGNRHAFIDIVLRLFNNCKMNVPSAMIEILADNDKDFENVAYAFISGLSSDRYIKENKEENEESER